MGLRGPPARLLARLPVYAEPARGRPKAPDTDDPGRGD